MKIAQNLLAIINENICQLDISTSDDSPIDSCKLNAFHIYMKVNNQYERIEEIHLERER